MTGAAIVEFLRQKGTEILGQGLLVRRLGVGRRRQRQRSQRADEDAEDRRGVPGHGVLSGGRAGSTLRGHLFAAMSRCPWGLHDLVGTPLPTSTPTRGRTFQDAKRDVLARFERDYFTALYAECNGNVSEIGRRAAMERAHVRGYLRRHGIGDPKKSSE